jgi:hypothetical protein
MRRGYEERVADSKDKREEKKPDYHDHYELQRHLAQVKGFTFEVSLVKKGKTCLPSLKSNKPHVFTSKARRLTIVRDVLNDRSGTS